MCQPLRQPLYAYTNRKWACSIEDSHSTFDDGEQMPLLLLQTAYRAGSESRSCTSIANICRYIILCVSPNIHAATANLSHLADFDSLMGKFIHPRPSARHIRANRCCYLLALLRARGPQCAVVVRVAILCGPAGACDGCSQNSLKTKACIMACSGMELAKMMIHF